MATQQELQASLARALAAYESLMLGTTKVSVSITTGVGSRTITYGKTNIADLERYIAWLRRQIAGVSPTRNRLRYVAPIDS